MDFLLFKTIQARHAKHVLPRLMALTEQFANSPAKALAQTLRSWMELIAREDGDKPIAPLKATAKVHTQ